MQTVPFSGQDRVGGTGWCPPTCELLPELPSQLGTRTENQAAICQMGVDTKSNLYQSNENGQFLAPRQQENPSSGNKNVLGTDCTAEIKMADCKEVNVAECSELTASADREESAQKVRTESEDKR